MIRTAAVLAALMIAAAVVGVTGRIEVKRPEQPSLMLDVAVPKTFGAWREIPQRAMVVNPQTQELLDKLYSQTLQRSYVNDQGYLIMLSMAYGDDQRGGLQAHRPEVCYPAQGFKLHETMARIIPTRFGEIAGRQLHTSMGPRSEPITYWFNMGNEPVTSTMQKRWVEFRLLLSGQVPDGVLLRVSSIDDDKARGWKMQEQFVAQLMDALSAENRVRLAGLRGATPPQ